jgi:predicted DNA-binding protein
MLAVKINDPYIDRHLAKQAHLQGKSRQRIVRDILYKQAEDAEDYASAMESLNDPAPSIPLKEVMKRYGMDY